MRGPIFSALIFILLMFEAAPACAADIKRSDHPAYNVILEGTITAGDYDKLRALIDENCPRKWEVYCLDRIYLASPGGSLLEAMKIGHLIRKLRWQTEIPEEVPLDLRQAIVTALKLKDTQTDFMCASACFFIYVAGIERNSIFSKGLLGIHRPYLSAAELKKLSAEQAMASAAQVRTIVDSYLKEMGVPAKYSDLMFSIPRDQMRWISPTDFEADFTGIVPELRDWMSAKCERRTDVEKQLTGVLDEKRGRGQKFTPEEDSMWHVLLQKGKDQVHCEEMVRDQMQKDAWKAYRGL